MMELLFGVTEKTLVEMLLFGVLNRLFFPD